MDSKSLMPNPKLMLGFGMTNRTVGCFLNNTNNALKAHRMKLHRINRDSVYHVWPGWNSARDQQDPLGGQNRRVSISHVIVGKNALLVNASRMVSSIAAKYILINTPSTSTTVSTATHGDFTQPCSAMGTTRLSKIG
jgi:hypothetical protein